MGFASFVTSVYADVPNKHSQTLANLRSITVRQLAELSSRRTLFMQDTVTFTLPASGVYNGEWAGPGLPGFPLDIMEVDGAYYQVGSGREEIEGPVPIADLRTYIPPLIAAQSPVAVYPRKWAWWDDKLWITQVGTDVVLELDIFRDATRDRATGVKIQTDSTSETNGWFERGEIPLRYAVLAEYFLLPLSRDEIQAQMAATQRNLFLDTLAREVALHTGSAIQAPMYM